MNCKDEFVEVKFRFFIKDIVIAFLNLRRIDVFLFIGI